MLVTVDTNVLFQALRNSNGASYRILELIGQQKLRLALSVPVFTEYEDVLTRKSSLEEFGLTKKDVRAVLQMLAYVAIPYTIYFNWRPNLRDEVDNIFMELAFTSISDALITSNLKDFTVSTDLKMEDINVVTPAGFLQEWRERNEE